jgi:hypothetical protein
MKQLRKHHKQGWLTIGPDNVYKWVCSQIEHWGQLLTAVLETAGATLLLKLANVVDVGGELELSWTDALYTLTAVQSPHISDRLPVGNY